MAKKTALAGGRDLGSYGRRYQIAARAYEGRMVESRRILALAEMRRHSHRRMLEVGCGMRPLFSDFGGFDKMTVLEPAPAFFANARRELKKTPPRRAAKIELLNGRLEDSAKILREREFDFAFAVGMLHEVEDARAAVRALRRALPRGAILHVNVPNARSFHRLLGVEMGLMRSEYERSRTQKALQQPRVFDAESLRALIRGGGFEILREGPCSFKLFTHRQMAKLEAIGFLTPRMRAGLERMSQRAPEMAAEIFATARAE